MLNFLKDHPALAQFRPPEPRSLGMSVLVIFTMAAAGMVTWLVAAPKTIPAPGAVAAIPCGVDPSATLPASAGDPEVAPRPSPIPRDIESLAGTVVDRYGKPVPAALVRLEGALDKPSLETSAEGRFHIAKVSQATAILLINHPGYVPTRRRLSSADSELQDLRLVLWRHPTLRAHGRVTGGTPSFERSGISVRLKRIVTQHDGRRIMLAESWLACTDEDGTYTVAALLPGRYLVEARVSGATLQTAGFILSEEEVAAGGDISIPPLVFKPWASGGRATLASAR